MIDADYDMHPEDLQTLAKNINNKKKFKEYFIKD